MTRAQAPPHPQRGFKLPEPPDFLAPGNSAPVLNFKPSFWYNFSFLLTLTCPNRANRCGKYRVLGLAQGRVPTNIGKENQVPL